MNERQGPPGEPHEPVGSVGEEAAKLFGALSDWAREQRDEPGGSAGAAFAHGLRDAAGHVADRVADHDAGPGGDCRWCPVCQVIHVVRQTSPEVREHLASAAGSLAQAVAGMLATTPPSQRGPVERIDLDDEPGWDDEPGRGERRPHDRDTGPGGPTP